MNSFYPQRLGISIFLLSVLFSSGSAWSRESREALVAPTPAYPVAHVFPEWAPAECVWMSVPLKALESSPEKQEYLLSLLRILLPELPVCLLYDEDQEEGLLFLEERLERDPDLQPWLERRLEFVHSKVQSEWIRDFGPVFAQGEEGSLVLLDHGYRGLEHMKRMWKMELEALYTQEDEAFKQRRRQSELLNFFDDITPHFMSSRIARRGQAVELVKPPLFLATGDFATDGKGTIFITEDTLVENGGSRAVLRQTMQEYYNAKEVYILFATPGNSTRHLDMIFKLASEDVLLVADSPPTQEKNTAQQRRLLQSLRGTLADNRNLLQTWFPDKKILSLPMPPVLFSPRSEIEKRITERIMDAVGEKAGLDMLRVRSADPNSRLYQEAMGLIRGQLQRDLGSRALDNPEWLKDAAPKYLGRELENLVAGYLEERIFYRTYVNSLQVRLPEGKELVLIPRYRPRAGEDPALFQKMEAEVWAVYKEAYPGAELHWVDSDAMIDYLGAVHCTTLTQPYLGSGKT